MTNSIALLATQSPEMTMTLKEITDMLNVRHDNAMRAVAEMLSDPSFGHAPQIEERYNSGRNILITYALTKRQSIAVASRLNTPLLMSIIDRWQELEDAQQVPVKPVKPIDEMTRKELMVFLTEMACDTEDMVHVMNGKLALGKFCTWTQYCKANSKLYAFRNPMKLCWLPPMIAARADVDGWETFVMGNQDATTALSPNSYPALLLHEFVKDSLLKREKYAHLAAQTVPYEADLTLEIPAATRVMLERAKQAVVALRIIPNA